MISKDTETTNIARTYSNEQARFRRNLEKATVSIVNINEKRNELKVSNKEISSIISPIFNSQTVVSTSTPSLIDTIEQQVQKNNDLIINTNGFSKSCQSFSSNQGFIKIISDDENNNNNNKLNKTSALNELNNCIAEFEKYKNIPEKFDKQSINIQSNNKKQTENEKLHKYDQSTTVIDVKPYITDNVYNYHQLSLPNRPLPNIFSTTPTNGTNMPPPPPPLPSFSLTNSKLCGQTWSKGSIKNEYFKKLIKIIVFKR